MIVFSCRPTVHTPLFDIAVDWKVLWSSRNDQVIRNHSTLITEMGVARFLCLGDGGMAYNERIITVGIGWVLLASATSGFSDYIKPAYCSTAKGAPVAQLARASD